jgi:hypothetical protein
MIVGASDSLAAAVGEDPVLLEPDPRRCGKLRLR